MRHLIDRFHGIFFHCMGSLKTPASDKGPFFLVAFATVLGYFYYSSKMKPESNTSIATKVSSAFLSYPLFWTSPIQAVVILTPQSEPKVTGIIRFEQPAYPGPVTVTGDVKGLSPNAKRGFHVQWAYLPFEAAHHSEWQSLDQPMGWFNGRMYNRRPSLQSFWPNTRWPQWPCSTCRRLG